jgi:hypothetical protein
MLRLIELGQPVGRAIGKVVDDYTRLFSRSSNPRLREKVQDVQDLARRLLRNLHRPAESASDYQGCVVVTADLMPSDMIKLAAERAEGLLLVGGGVTAHVSILARSLRIPVVVVEERGFLKLPPGHPRAAGWRPGDGLSQPRPGAARQSTTNCARPARRCRPWPRASARRRSAATARSCTCWPM